MTLEATTNLPLSLPSLEADQGAPSCAAGAFWLHAWFAMEPEIEYSSDGFGENEALLASVSLQDRSTGSVIPSTTIRRLQNPEASATATLWSAPAPPSVISHGETKTSIPTSIGAPDPLSSRSTWGTPAGCDSEVSVGGGDGSRLSAGVPPIHQIEHSVTLPLGSNGSASSNATAGGDGARAIRLQMQQRSELELGEEEVSSASGDPAASRGASHALATAARVPTRLVSASGPVANNTTAARLRRVAAAFSMPRSSASPSDSPGGIASSRGVSRHGNRRGGQGLAVQRTLRELAGERGRRRSVSRQRMRTGELQSAQEDIEREAGESVRRESVDGAREEVPAEQSGASSSGGESESAAVMEPAPADIRRALASSHNTISLLLLLLLHYVVTHFLAMAAFFVGTVLLLQLDRHLRSHAEAQVLKSRFILVGVAVTAACTIGLSAATFNKFPWGDGLLRGLLLEAPKPDMGDFSAVIGRTIIVDLWARFLSLIVKAVLALLSARNPNSGNSAGRCATGYLPVRLFSCGGLHRCRRRFDVSRLSGRDRNRFGVSLRRDHEGDGGESTGDGGSQDSRGARRLCGARRWFGCGGRGEEPRRAATESDDERGNDGDGEAGRDREGERSTVAFSRAGRQRRVNAMVEMAFLLYRCVLPVPVWIEYYSKDSSYFAAVYLVLKGMEVSFRTDRLARAACYIRRGDLDRGKFATPEEVAEAGSPDCPICYDRMERPLILPCSHLFCVECVVEWLDRERTCPLCRAEFATSNPIPRSLRDGRTTVVPQIL